MSQESTIQPDAPGDGDNLSTPATAGTLMSSGTFFEEGAAAQTKPKKTGGGPVDPRLFRRAKATRAYMISGVAVGSVTAVLVLCQAKLLSSTIASVFATQTLQGLPLALGLLALVLVGRGVLAWASSWLAQRTSAAVKSQLRRDILRARLASPAHQTSTSSTLVTLITQGLDALDGYFSKYLPQLLLAVTVPLIVGAAILFSDWRTALILAATIPLIPVLMALVGWTTEKQVAKRWAFQARLASHFADLVTGLPTLQVFGRARAQAEGLKRSEYANRRETMAILRMSFLSAFVLELFSTLAVAVIALVIGTRLVWGQMDFSTALFVLILAPEVYLPIRQVGVHYHDSADGLAAAEAAFSEIDRVARVEDAPGSSEDAARAADEGVGDTRPGDGFATTALAPPDQTSTMTPARRMTISAKRLTYTYPDGATTVGPFDLDVAPGEVVALSGRSGGGKTTLLNCLLGFLEPDGHDPVLVLGGVDSRQVDWTAWRASLAYVPQIPGIVDGTIADNVRLGAPEASDDEVREALAAAGAVNLDPARGVGEEGEGLSVGERRRVGLARALARINTGGAALLILDEPTAGLDTATEAGVLAALRESGATALVVSHREAVLEQADRVVTIGPSGQARRESSGTGKAALSYSYAAPADPVVADTSGEPEVANRTSSPLLRLVFSLLDSVPGARMRLVAAIILAACASGAAVGLMGVSAWLISKAAEHPPFLELSVAAVGVRFFGISRGVFRYVERLVGHDVALSMQSALRLRVYQVLAKTTLLGRRQGDLLVRVVSDVSAIDDVIVRIVQPFLAASLVVVAVVAMIARFSIAAAALILLSAIAGGVIVPWLSQRGSMRADEAAVPLRGELGVVVHDISRTATDVAAYGATERALSRMEKVDRALVASEERAAWYQGIGAGLQTIVAGIGFVGGLWIGALAVADGTLGGRMLAVLVLVPMSLHEVFSTFTQAAQTWTRARVALGRVNAVLDAKPVGQGDVSARDADEEPTLTCENLTVGWPDHPPVVSGVNLAVRPGRAVAVMGPSGIGKTTLAATVMGLIPPVAGSLATTGRVGYLAQDAHIFATSVAENVRIGNKDATDEEVATALEEAGLSMAPDRRVGEMGVGLSGGEIRRLALARLFVGDYRLLILDEPTEHLDRETADTLMDDIFSNIATRPAVIISHDESVAARCDEVLVLEPDPR